MITLKDVRLDISEKEYRAMDCLSYSALSGVSKRGYKSLVEEIYMSVPMKIGIIVESILFGYFNIDDWYIYSEDATIPGDTLRNACDIVFPLVVSKYCKEGDDISKVVSADINTYADDIEQIFKTNKIEYYKKRSPQSRTKTMIKDSGSYWRHYVLSSDKIIISKEDYDKSKSMVDSLNTNKYTSHIFSKSSFDNVEKIAQYAITFDYNGVKFKSLIDWIIVNHDKKTIQVIDLKTGGHDPESFPYVYYDMRYDIQDYIYTEAARSHLSQYFPEYVLLPMKFVYISSNYIDKPMIWQSRKRNHTKKGFWRNNKYYKGVDELIDEYKAYKEGKTVYYPPNEDGVYYINDFILSKDESFKVVKDFRPEVLNNG